jgi:hypothetical protein
MHETEILKRTRHSSGINSSPRWKTMSMPGGYGERQIKNSKEGSYNRHVWYMARQIVPYNPALGKIIFSSGHTGRI